MKRVKFFELSILIQVIAIKDTSGENGFDCIRFVVFGYTTEGDYLEFKFCIEFLNEIKRDEEFEKLTPEQIKASIEGIVKSSQIPMQII